MNSDKVKMRMLGGKGRPERLQLVNYPIRDLEHLGGLLYIYL
jgi:hypothetical protein